ncbi:MAG: hypothetical protein WCP97_00525 [bacterium]
MTYKTFSSAKATVWMGHEATFRTPVKPTIQIPVLSAEFGFDPGIKTSETISGNAWKNQKNPRFTQTKGDGKFEMELFPSLTGEVLKLLCGAPTTGSPTAGVYTHTFLIDLTKILSATFQFDYPDFGYRSFGSVIDEVTFKIKDSTWQVEVKTFAAGRYAITLLKALAASGATTLVLDDQGGAFKPTEGLVATDVLIAEFENDASDEDVTISTVVDAKTLTVSATTASHAAGVKMVLKPFTASDVVTGQPFNFGRTSVLVNGTAYDCTDGFEFGFKKNLKKFAAAGNRSDAYNVGMGAAEVGLKGLDRVYNGGGSLLDKLNDGKTVPIVIDMIGLDAGSGTGTDQLTVSMPAIMLSGKSDMEGKGAKGADDTAMDSFEAIATYDPTTSKTIGFVLKNTTASYA